MVSAGVSTVSKIGFRRSNQEKLLSDVRALTVTLSLPRLIMKAVLPGSPCRHKTWPAATLRRMTNPCCQSKNLGGIPAKMGSEINSCAVRVSAERSLARIFIWATGLKVIALVGHETMHSPHCTQVD